MDMGVGRKGMLRSLHGMGWSTKLFGNDYMISGLNCVGEIKSISRKSPVV